MYADNQTQGFHLQDDLSLKKDPFLGGLPADAVVTACKCVPTMMSKPGTVAFNIPTEGSLVTLGDDALFRINGTAEIVDMLPPIQYVCPNPVPPPATITYMDDPATFSFDLFLGLVSVGGLSASDGVTEFKVDEPPLLKIVIQWSSMPE